MIGTNNPFDGVRLWIGNDISEIDDAASSAALFLGAKNISESDANVTGSADKLSLEGAFTDTVRIAPQWIDRVEAVVNEAGQRYGIDLYSPRTDIDIGAGASQFRAAFTQSLDTAFANNEQVLVLTGGPTRFAADTVLDWVRSAPQGEQAARAVWALQGGYTQATHGDGGNFSDDILDFDRDAGRNYFNITSGSAETFDGVRIGNTGQTIQIIHEILRERLVDIAQDGLSQAEFAAVNGTFVPNSLLLSLEDQNQNSAVRGPIGQIRETIADDLARDAAVTYTKQNGQQIDFSDVGLLGLLLNDGKEFDANDARTFLQPVNTTPSPTPDPDDGEGYYASVGSGNSLRFKIQIEDAGPNPGGQWRFESAADSGGNQQNFQGEGYYVYGNETSITNNGSPNANEVLSYRIFIPDSDAGTFTLSMRASRDPGGPSDRRNDAWVNIVRESDGAEITDLLISNNRPEPESQGFIKAFGASTGGFASFQQFDGAPNNGPISLDLSQGGFYTIEIGGRSQGYHLDYFELFKGSQPSASAPDSQFISGNPGTPQPTPDPDPDPAPQPPVPQPPVDVDARFFLIDPATDTRIAELSANSTINLAELPNGLSVEVVPPSSLADVARVALLLNGQQVQIENFAPYALFGDNSGDFNGGTLDEGALTIGANFIASNGAVLGTADVGVSVIDSTVVTPDPDPSPQPQPDPQPDPDPQPTPDPQPDPVSETSFYLIDALTNTRVQKLGTDSIINTSLLDGYSVEVVPADDVDVARVVFTINGNFVRSESVAPYALFGDIGPDFNSGSLPTGDLALGATVIARNGQIVDQTSVSVTVTDETPSPEPYPVPKPDMQEASKLLDFALADAASDVRLTKLFDKTVLGESERSDTLTVLAEAKDGVDDIGSVLFSFNGNVQVENVTPYALFGNVGENLFDGTDFEEGTNTVNVEIFEGRNATGELLERIDLDIVFVNGDYDLLI